MITPADMSISLGPFRLTAPLGQGGSGQVWSAVHATQGVPVAIKLIPASPGAAHAGERTAEVRALAALDHPNVLMVFDHGDVPATVVDPRIAPGSAWIATELCSGGSLSRAGPRNWNQLRRVAKDILAGLAYAHARGVLHRDLTPGNVLISAVGDVRPGLKLGDFGLAGRVSRSSGAAGRIQVAGTPGFMAPEQFDGDPSAYGPWTDAYGLGCLLWCLCTGDAPFGTTRPPAVLAAAHRELELPAFVPRFDVPSGLEVLIRALLEKQPGDRVQSASETLTALDVVDGQPERGVPSDWRSGAPRRTPMRLVGAGLGLHAFRSLPLIGRDGEREQLWSALLEVLNTRGARILHVVGPAGIGKSALIRWLSERALETGVARVAEVHADGPDPLAAIAVALSEAWPTPPAQRADPAPVLAAATEAQRRLALARLVASVRAGGPVLLHVRGGASADEGVARLLTVLRAIALVEGAAGGLLVVVTSRSASNALEGALALGPLAPAHQVHLVEGVLGLSGDVALEVRQRSAVNPGFAVALAGDLIGRGALEATETGFTGVSGVSFALPESLEALWASRVGALALPADAVALAALLGPVVPAAVWRRACEVARVADPEAVWPALEAAAFAEPDPVGWRWTQGVAMESARTPTPALHAACAAGWLGVDDRRSAQHLLQAGMPLEAARLWLAVARSGLRRGPREAVAAARACERALAQAAVPEGDAVWGEAGVLLTRALVELGDWAQAGPESERLLRSARDFGWSAALAPALVLRGEVARGQGDPVRAKSYLQEAIALCTARGDDQGLARAARGLGRVALGLGRYDEAGRWFQQAQAMFTRLGNAEGAGACLLHRADIARFAGNGALAGELLAQAQRALDRAPHVIGAALVTLLEAELALLSTPTPEVLERARAGFLDALHVLETVGAASLVSRAAFGLGRSGAGAVWFTRALRAAQGAQDLAAVAVATCGLVGVYAEDAASSPASLERFVSAVADAKSALSRVPCVHPEAHQALERAAVASPHPALQSLLVEQRAAERAAKLAAKTNLPES